MTKHERKNLEYLQKRAAHLGQRIDKAIGSPGSLSWDRAELKALQWALARLAPLCAADPDELRRAVADRYAARGNLSLEKAQARAAAPTCDACPYRAVETPS